MYQNKEYDVLTFVAFHQGCYASADVVLGLPLALWVKNQSYVNKEVFYDWIYAFYAQVFDFQNCGKNPGFGFVNPWAYIVSDRDEIFLADIQSENNLELLKIMKKRNVRELFLPEEEPYYQRRSLSLDVYGLGKTIQFLMSSIEVIPELSTKERKMIERFIQKCIRQYEKNPIEDLEDLEKLERGFPVYVKRTSLGSLFLNSKKWKLVLAVMVLAVSIFSYKNVFSKEAREDSHAPREDESMELSLEKTIKNEDKISEGDSSDCEGDEVSNDKDIEWTDEQLLNLELGCLYFMEVNEYEKSEGYFQKVEGDAVANGFRKIANCLQYEVIPEKSLLSAISEARGCEEKDVDDGLKAFFYAVILKAYGYLDMEDVYEDVLDLGERYLEMDERFKVDVLNLMAMAYESSDDLKKAISMYQEELESVEGDEMKEKLYVKLAQLYMQAEDQEHALSTIKEGIEKYNQSSELYMERIKIYLKDKQISKKECISEIQDAIEVIPNFAKDQSLLKLLEEYELKIEKGKVCEVKK